MGFIRIFVLLVESSCAATVAAAVAAELRVGLCFAVQCRLACIMYAVPPDATWSVVLRCAAGQPWQCSAIDPSLHNSVWPSS
jgi:hypothetical protein